jgi:ABC-type glycerol-3-phosphate transport system substrate-binding protein
MTRRITRRRLVQTGSAAGALTLAAPYVRRAYGAGQVTVMMWDHWVPGANDVLARLAREWGEANNVQVTVDFVTSLGDQNLVTLAAESRARSGHDIVSMPTFQTAIHAQNLEPLDDLMEELIGQYGPLQVLGEYLGKIDGTWRSVPTSTGSQSYPMNSRIDYWRDIVGIDMTELFPAGERDQARIDEIWTYEKFLGYAEQLHAGGHPFGDPIGQTSDSQDWLGPLFFSHGSRAVDENGDIVIDSDETRAALEYMERLTRFMPPDVYAWDDAGNNRWLISGNGSAIHNPPSPWTVARRDAPEVAAQIWHHDVPAGPLGNSYRGSLPYFWGIWEFAANKSAAKDLLRHMMQKEQQAQLIEASLGYDMPLFEDFADNKVWVEAEPPPGSIYNYPLRGNEELYIAGFPAPPQVAAQVYLQALFPNLVAKVTQEGLSHDDAIAWAEDELQGFLRG